MAVNLLEEDRLVYHDEDADTLVIRTNQAGDLIFDADNENCGPVAFNRGAVETLRDSLTCWLETGKLR